MLSQGVTVSGVYCITANGALPAFPGNACSIIDYQELLLTFAIPSVRCDMSTYGGEIELACFIRVNLNSFTVDTGGWTMVSGARDDTTGAF